MKKRLKKIILSILFFCKYSHYKHFKNRHKITVLMLHGVMENHAKCSWKPLRPQLTPNELKRTLSILSEYYQFINIEQCIDILKGEAPVIDNAMLLTFDDGYLNNINYALPVCESFNIKPTLFIATGHIDSGNPFWFDRLDYALQQNMGKRFALHYLHHEFYFDATNKDVLKVSYQYFRDQCKSLFRDDIEMSKLFDNLSLQLEERSGKSLAKICENDDWSAIATWEILNRCVKNNRLDIGSHTINHWRLDRLEQSQLQSQLVKSKAVIENKIATKCHYFCYPNGNYNKESISLLKKSGYKAAFSTDVGLCKSKDDLMTLKRFNFPSNKTKSELLYLLNS